MSIKYNRFKNYIFFPMFMFLVFCCIFLTTSVNVHAEEINFPIVPNWYIDDFTPEDCISYFNSLGYSETTTTQYLIVLNGSNSYYYFLDVYATRLPMEDGTFADGRPLSITSRSDPYFIELGSYTTDREFRFDKQSHNFVGDTTTDKYFSNASQILYLSSRSVYFKGSEDIAIQYTVDDDDPGLNLQGHPVPPNFDDDTVVPNVPEDNTFTAAQLLSKILNSLNGFKNIVKSGFQNVYDNFSNFFSPYLESFKNGIDSLVSGVTTFKDSVLDLFSIFKDDNGNPYTLSNLIVPTESQEAELMSMYTSSPVGQIVSNVDYIVSFFIGLFNSDNLGDPILYIDSFVFAGVTIPAFEIDFTFLKPYKPYYDAAVSFFLAIGFAWYFITHLAAFIRGESQGVQTITSSKGDKTS